MFEPDWAPSPADVGAVVRARTKDNLGNELGTFTSATRPTADGVNELIETAIAEVSGECGTIPDQVQDNARRVTAIYAAAQVELSYYPEQVNSGRSPYPQLMANYSTALARLKVQVGELLDGGTLGDSELLPQFAFPDNCDMIGLQTRW